MLVGVFRSWFQFMEMNKSEERQLIGLVRGSLHTTYTASFHDFLRTRASHSIHTSMLGMLALIPKPLTRAWTRLTRYSRGMDSQVGQLGSSARS